MAIDLRLLIGEEKSCDEYSDRARASTGLNDMDSLDSLSLIDCFEELQLKGYEVG